jgi:hypothetical protein
VLYIIISLFTLRCTLSLPSGKCICVYARVARSVLFSTCVRFSGVELFQTWAAKHASAQRQHFPRRGALKCMLRYFVAQGLICIKAQFNCCITQLILQPNIVMHIWPSGGKTAFFQKSRRSSDFFSIFHFNFTK